MSPCCPNCGSAQSLGNEAASVCNECATATVSGASISLPLFLVAVFAAGVAVMAFRVLRGRASGILQMSRPAVR